MCIYIYICILYNYIYIYIYIISLSDLLNVYYIHSGLSLVPPEPEREINLVIATSYHYHIKCGLGTPSVAIERSKVSEHQRSREEYQKEQVNSFVTQHWGRLG